MIGKYASIRQAVTEGSFEKLLQNVTHTQTLFRARQRMLEKQWKNREAMLKEQKAEMQKQLAEIEKQVDTLLDNIINVTRGSVIQAFEKHIDGLEKEKLLAEEKLDSMAQPPRALDEISRTDLLFVKNPSKIL